MVAEIVPFLKLPRATTVFDYSVPTNLELVVEPGTLVIVPFRKRRRVTGIVVHTKPQQDKGRFTLRPLKEILPREPLKKSRIMLAHAIAAYYYCNLSAAYKLVV